VIDNLVAFDVELDVFLLDSGQFATTLYSPFCSATSTSCGVRTGRFETDRPYDKTLKMSSTRSPNGS